MIWGDFVEPIFARSPAEQKRAFGELVILGDDPQIALARMPSAEFESTRSMLSTQDGTSPRREGNGMEFRITFTWPGNDGVAAAMAGVPNFKYWIERENVSVTVLDGTMRGAQIFAAAIKPGAEIFRGSCVLTVNGVIQRRFTVPTKVDDGGAGFGAIYFPGESAPEKANQSK